MNKAKVSKESEVAIVLANAPLPDGRRVHWMLSRKQVVYILREIQEKSPAGGNSLFPIAPYLEELLPVINLEKYYGLKTSGEETRTGHYVVTRATRADGTIGKSILQMSHPVRIRKLNFTAVPVEEIGLPENSEDTLGFFMVDDSDLVVIPDISVIIAKNINEE